MVGDSAKRLHNVLQSTLLIRGNMANKAEVLEQLNALRLLENDWDEEGALSIKEDAIRGAEAFLEALEGMPELLAGVIVFPCRNRNVELLWQTEKGRYMLYFSQVGEDVCFRREKLVGQMGWAKTVSFCEAIRELKIFLNS